MKRFKAAVIGGSGYGGAELIRRLILHPDVELVRVASVDYVGELLSAAHPNLEGRTELRFENVSPGEAARGMDVVLLGLPHRVSAQKVPEILATGAKIVDLSGDFRLRSAEDYRRYYGVEHPSKELLGTFVYGLPELNRERIRGARYVASPGCFATTIELGLLPLARAGWLAGEVEVVGITGSSGAGVVPAPTTHQPTRAVNLRTYKPLEHQHIPEIAETLGQAGARELALRFVPVSAPLPRGIFATSFAHVPAAVDAEAVARAFRESYAGEPFVRVPAKRLPEVAAVSGSNHVEVGFAVAGEVDGASGRRCVACFSASDNLIKGGAGQAIQSMNLMLGLDERLTLEESRVVAVGLVVKLGGEVVGDARLAGIASDLVGLARDGWRVTVVHGGGPQATELQKRLGIEPRVVGGRRVTDAATLDVMKMVVAGRLNVDLCAAIAAAGGRPVGLHDAIRARRRPPQVISGGGAEPVDLGLVGDVTGFDGDLIEAARAGGRVPVLACLGMGEGGEIYNINADVVANRLAVALDADLLVLVTSVDGVRRDLADPASRIPVLTVAEGRRAIAEGVVSGGMIPKLEESFAALAEGVRRILIVAGEVGRAVREPGSAGTRLEP